MRQNRGLWRESGKRAKEGTVRRKHCWAVGKMIVKKIKVVEGNGTVAGRTEGQNQICTGEAGRIVHVKWNGSEMPLLDTLGYSHLSPAGEGLIPETGGFLPSSTYPQFGKFPSREAPSDGAGLE